MNWKEEIERRLSVKKPLEKEVYRIRKEIQRIGSVDPMTVMLDGMCEEHNLAWVDAYKQTKSARGCYRHILFCDIDDKRFLDQNGRCDFKRRFTGKDWYDISCKFPDLKILHLCCHGKLITYGRTDPGGTWVHEFAELPWDTDKIYYILVNNCSGWY